MLIVGSFIQMRRMLMQKQRRIVIAGTGSGSGKTTVTIGLMAAFRKEGLIVQGFKCGPDYIDPSYHTSVTGRASRNLDSWMLDGDAVQEIYARASQNADISIIEGVMGFYDGRDPKSNEGSTAHISTLLNSPVILVVDCGGSARSAAAVVKGFQCFDPKVNIVGVFANRVGSEGHYRLIREAVEQECGIPAVGYLIRDDRWSIPERHLGLIPSIERGELNDFFAALGERMAETTDLERVLAISEAPMVEDKGMLFGEAARSGAARKQKVRVAIARDAAFNFYYPENLELLESYGAELLFFSPLAGETVPKDAEALYIGGGFPEEFAEVLSANEKVKESVIEAIDRGVLTLAECGGFMYLTDALVDTTGMSYPMVGLIPGKAVMQSKLAALGYREIRGESGNCLLGPDETARGHEFHYSTFEPKGELPHAYESKGLRGTKLEGFLVGSAVAGYTHLHFGSNPRMIQRWLEQAAKLSKFQE
jgi:cobyrinic acid a,c-diamide synthase